MHLRHTVSFGSQFWSVIDGGVNPAEDVEIFRCITNNSAVVQGRIVRRTSSPSVVIVTRDCTRRGSVRRVASFSRHSTEAIAKHAKFRVLYESARSLPCYMFLVPTLVTVLVFFFQPGHSPFGVTLAQSTATGRLCRLWRNLAFSYGYCDSCFVSIQPTNKARTGAVQSRVVALLRSLDLKPPIPPRWSTSLKKGSRHSAQHCLCDIALPDHLSRVQIEPILRGTSMGDD